MRFHVCRLWLSGAIRSKQHTATISNEHNPVWGEQEEHAFLVAIAQHQKLKLALWDHDEMLGDDEIGRYIPP